MKVNIFSYDDYRPALRAVLVAKKSQHLRMFTCERFARACRVQKSYLSRALGGHAHLSDDQLFVASEFLGLTPAESDYIFLLHSFLRSGNARRRDQLAATIKVAQARSERSESVIEARSPSADALRDADYHLDPNAILIHLFMTVPRYCKNPESIALELGLSRSGLELGIEKLLRLGVLTFDETGYHAQNPSSHVAIDSPLYRAYCVMQRTKTLERITRELRDDSYHFSVAFSANEEIRKELKERFLALLKEIQPRVANAPAESVFQMNFDLFRWST